MKINSQRILLCLGLIGIIVCFAGCNLLKSPVSMVKKFGIWQFAEDDEWRGYFTSGPTWEQVIKKYQYFEKYDSSKWSKQELGGQWYLHYVNYATKFNDVVTDERLSAFVINNKKVLSVEEARSYFRKGVRASEELNYAGHNLIYSTQDKERIQKVITELGSGNVTDISLSNAVAVLRWVTNKMGDKDYGEDVIFVGTYIIADVKLKNNDETETSYDELTFYTPIDEPMAPYRFNRPYSFF